MTSRPASRSTWRSAASRSALGLSSSTPSSAIVPGPVNAATRSTWPSVSRSSSSPKGSQTTRSTPSRARSSASISSRDQPGLRFGLSRHSSVVTSVPAPSTAIAPPSSTIAERSHGRPSWSHRRPAIVASSSHGGNFPPHALKPNWMPRPSSRKIGPLSRSHESSMGASQISTAPASAVRASAPSPGRHTMSTGSKAAIALATPAVSRRASASAGPHSSRRHGQAMRVRSCGASSAGIGIVVASLACVAGLQLEATARSDVGRRRANNEDSVFASPRLVAVADGVGGAVAGEIASRTVIDALHHLDKCRLESSLDEALAGAIAAGNDTIAFLASAQPELTGMGTTLTAVALDGDGYVVANVGDSRTYLLRDGELERLTRDDSWLQEVTESGALSPDEARAHPYRSVVLAALDGDPRRTPALRRVAARAGDRLLLCSDGLSDFVDEGEIAETLALAPRETCADRLIELALATGGRDNVSVVVADATERAGDDSLWS